MFCLRLDSNLTIRRFINHLLTYLLTYPPTYLFTCLPTYLRTYLPTYLPTYLLTNRKNLLTFGGYPYHFSTSLTIAEYGILGDLLAFLIQSPADFHDSRRND